MGLFKTISIVIICFIALGASIYVWAEFTRPLLVLDMQNIAALPNRFRTTSDPIDDRKINQEGFSELHALGSGQFSDLALQYILQRFSPTHLNIVDLRQESHGFVNGNAISWYGAHDAANQGKTPSQIDYKQKQLLANIKPNSKLKIYNIQEKSEADIIKRAKPMLITVHEVQSEAEVAAKHQLSYHRLYVQDFHAPDNLQVDRFIKIVKQLPRNAWVYFHCRGGSGRTTTFMAMYDMMRNAKRISFTDVILREKAIAGKDLTELPLRDNYKYDFALERLNFLKKFYEYARNNADNYHTTWSSWLNSNK